MKCFVLELGYFYSDDSDILKPQTSWKSDCIS